MRGGRSRPLAPTSNEGLATANVNGRLGPGCGHDMMGDRSVSESLRVVMTLAFYPRGGSAQVARYLGDVLAGHGWTVTVCCGSLGSPGSDSHAATFFADLDVQTLDFTEAVEWFEQGRIRWRLRSRCIRRSRIAPVHPTESSPH